MNLREKGRSNLMVQRRSRREHNRFRPSRYPLPSPPDRIRGKIQASTRQSHPEPAAGDVGAGRRRQALRFAIPCHRPFLLSRRSLAASRRPSLIPFIHYSERAQQTVPQLPNPFPAPSSPDFGRLLQLRAPPPHLSGELGIRGRYGANRMVFRVPRVFLRILQLSVSRVRPERLLAAVRRRGMAAAAGRLVPVGFVLGI